MPGVLSAGRFSKGSRHDGCIFFAWPKVSNPLLTDIKHAKVLFLR
jgi:hypothetical protein